MYVYINVIHTNIGDNMKKTSIWLDIKDQEKINKLNNDLDLDVLIIGGGITGLSTAYHLINSNLKVALVEKNKIGTGVTSKTTAKITYLQETIYTKLKNTFNEELSKKYLNSQIDAINIIKSIIEKNKIDCDFYKVDSYLFTNDQEKIKDVKDEKELLQKFNIKVLEETKLPNEDKINYGIKVSDTYVFHPIKYLYSLKKILINNNINIYEDSKIISIEKKDDYFICKTPNNLIKTKKVVLALHYPYFLFPYLFPMKTTLEKSYIGVREVEKFFEFSAINTSMPTKSIRYHKDKDTSYEIDLVASHNIAFKNNEKKNFNELNKVNDDYKYMWSNIDIITNDNLPFIGEINNNLLIGTGYNTWGMTNSTIAGKILSDIILNKENEYVDLFNPKRSINISKIINFPISMASNIKSFIGSKINKNKSWYSSNVTFKTIDGKKVGIYKDLDNKEHIVYNKCPHLGCSLEFNEIEKTWDCPCHGSRFNIDGRCIEGPSNYDIGYKDETDII